MVFVRFTFALYHMRIYPEAPLIVKTVSWVLMKRAAGELPIILLDAKVVAFGFHDALGHKIG